MRDRDRRQRLRRYDPARRAWWQDRVAVTVAIGVAVSVALFALHWAFGD